MHTPYRDLIPALAPEELAQLEANLLADGCRDPLVTWDDKLLDGHNRLDICQRHGLKFRTVALKLPDEEAAKVWIIRTQLGRRNITLFSRCELAKKLALALKPKAKEKQLAGQRSGGRGKKNLSPILAESLDVREQAAKEAGVSHGSLSAYEYLEKNAEPEELKELKRNPEAKLHAVVKIVKERKAKIAQKKKRREAAKAVKWDERTIRRDGKRSREFQRARCRKLSERIRFSNRRIVGTFFRQNDCRKMMFKRTVASFLSDKFRH